MQMADGVDLLADGVGEPCPNKSRAPAGFDLGRSLSKGFFRGAEDCTLDTARRF